MLLLPLSGGKKECLPQTFSTKNGIVYSLKGKALASLYIIWVLKKKKKKEKGGGIAFFKSPGERGKIPQISIPAHWLQERVQRKGKGGGNRRPNREGRKKVKSPPTLFWLPFASNWRKSTVSIFSVMKISASQNAGKKGKKKKSSAAPQAPIPVTLKGEVSASFPADD